MHICHRGSEEDRIVDKCNMGTKTGKKNGDVSDLDGGGGRRQGSPRA